MLEDILRLSETMLSAAKRGDFERLAQLERQRGELLAKIPELEVSPLQLAALGRIKALDLEILAILERERDKAAKDLLGLRHSRRAATVYAGSE